MQPLQKRERLAGLALGEQHARQHEILRLLRVRWLVVPTEAAFPRPFGYSRSVALGQQQPCPLRRDRVEEVGKGRAWRDPQCLADRLQRPGRIPLGLPDPGQRGEARGQWRGIDELPT